MATTMTLMVLLVGDIALAATISCPDAGICSGTNGNDRLVGTNRPDIMRGLLGDDVLVGRDCVDSIVGDNPQVGITNNDGNDTIRGGAGGDDIDGMGGSDTIRAGAGNFSEVRGGIGDVAPCLSVERDVTR